MPQTVSQLIADLQKVRAQKGDIEVVGGFEVGWYICGMGGGSLTKADKAPSPHHALVVSMVGSYTFDRD